MFLDTDGKSVVHANSHLGLPPPTNDDRVVHLRLPSGDYESGAQDPAMVVSRTIMPTSMVVFLKTPTVYTDHCRLHLSFQVVPAHRLPEGAEFRFVTSEEIAAECGGYDPHTGIGECKFEGEPCLALVGRRNGTMNGKVVSSLADSSVQLGLEGSLAEVTVREPVLFAPASNRSPLVTMKSPQSARQRGEEWRVHVVANTSFAVGAFTIVIEFNTSILGYDILAPPIGFGIGSHHLGDGVLTINRFMSNATYEPPPPHTELQLCDLPFYIMPMAPRGLHRDAITSVRITELVTTRNAVINQGVPVEVVGVLGGTTGAGGVAVETDTDAVIGITPYVTRRHLVLKPTGLHMGTSSVVVMSVRSGYGTPPRVEEEGSVVCNSVDGGTYAIPGVCTDFAPTLLANRSSSITVKAFSFEASVYLTVYAPLTMRLHNGSVALHPLCGDGSEFEGMRVRRMVVFTDGTVSSPEVDVTGTPYDFEVRSSNHMILMAYPYGSVLGQGVGDANISAYTPSDERMQGKVAPLLVQVLADGAPVEQTLQVAAFKGVRWIGVNPVLDGSTGALTKEGESNRILMLSMPSMRAYVRSDVGFTSDTPGGYVVSSEDEKPGSFIGTVPAGAYGGDHGTRAAILPQLGGNPMPSSCGTQYTYVNLAIPSVARASFKLGGSTGPLTLTLAAGKDDQAAEFGYHLRSGAVVIEATMSDGAVVVLPVASLTSLQSSTLEVFKDHAEGTLHFGSPTHSDGGGGTFNITGQMSGGIQLENSIRVTLVAATLFVANGSVVDNPAPASYTVSLRTIHCSTALYQVRLLHPHRGMANHVANL
jgi:hypothetical protein